MRKAKDLTTLDVFTAGQVAKLLLCSPRSVAKWFDAGKLKGYRLAGTSDRRIPRVNLLEFIQANGMPFPEGISCAAPVMTPEAA